MRLKIVKVFFISLLAYWISASLVTPVFAVGDNAFVSIVHPVRGRNLWEASPNVDPLELQSQLAQEKGLSVTWLLTYDALQDEELIAFLRNSASSGEIGILLEVGKKFAQAAGAEYSGHGDWNWANKVLLSGYKRQERIRLIDVVFKRFKEIFGEYPRSIGAWQLDAYSLDYITQKYRVDTALVGADQLRSGGYGVWGQYWSTPFYPAKTNALMPANSVENKLDIVVTQWSARDPLNAYGGGAATFSVQANDYTSKRHKLDIEYFKKLVDLYTDPKDNDFAHLVVGLETGSSVKLYNSEYKQQLGYVAEGISQDKFRAVTLSEFGRWYREQFPNLSPPHKIETNDLLGTERQVTWYMNPWYRIGILNSAEGTSVFDWRVYDNSIYGRYFWVKNINPVLDTAVPAFIDSARPVGEPIAVSAQNLAVKFQPQAVTFANDFSLEAKVKNNQWYNFLAGFYLAVLVVLIIVARKDWRLLLVSISGVVVWTLTMVKSGLTYEFGMGYWGPHGHDGIWHIALGNSLIQRALQMPVFAGEMIQNYHLGFDLILALLHKLTSIPVVNLYFQIIPPVVAFLIGFLTFKLVWRWKGSHWQAFFATFFVYFGGSWGWVITLYRNRIIGGETLFWSTQSISTLINPPFAVSLVILTLGLYLYLSLLKKATKTKLLLLIIIFGLIIQVKAYAGVVILTGLGSVLLYSIVQAILHRDFSEKTLKLHALLFLGTLGLAGLSILPTSKSVQNLIVFSPFWFIENLIASYDRLYWVKLANAMEVYKVTNNWPRLLAGEIAGLALFFIGNMGVRIIGLIAVARWFIKRRIDPFKILLLSMLVAAGTIPLLFIQRGTSWNTIQFFYYFLFLFSLLAGVVLGEFVEKAKTRFGVVRVVGVVLILTLPTTYGTLREYLGKNSPARLSYEELNGLDFLRIQPDGVVLTFPYDLKRRLKPDITYPLPLGIYETTAYVSALSNKTVYLEDEMNLTITGYDWESRKDKVLEFFKEKKAKKARKFLAETGTDYIYLVREQRLPHAEGALGFKKIFDNPEVRIYEKIDN